MAKGPSLIGQCKGYAGVPYGIQNIAYSATVVYSGSIPNVNPNNVITFTGGGSVSDSYLISSVPTSFNPPNGPVTNPTSDPSFNSFCGCLNNFLFEKGYEQTGGDTGTGNGQTQLMATTPGDPNAITGTPYTLNDDMLITIRALDLHDPSGNCLGTHITVVINSRSNNLFSASFNSGLIIRNTVLGTHTFTSSSTGSMGQTFNLTFNLTFS